LWVYGTQTGVGYDEHQGCQGNGRVWGEFLTGNDESKHGIPWGFSANHLVLYIHLFCLIGMYVFTMPSGSSVKPEKGNMASEITEEEMKKQENANEELENKV